MVTTPPRQCAPHHIMTGTGEFRTDAGTKLEIFSMSLKVGNVLGQVYTSDQARNSLLAAAADFWSAIIGQTQIDSGVNLTEVKVADIGSNTLYLGPPKVEEVQVVGQANGGPGSVPSETALKVTLKTLASGKHAGGFYVPGPHMNMANYRYNAGQVQALATIYGTALSNLSTALLAIPLEAGVTAKLRPAVVGTLLTSEDPTDAQENAQVRYVTALNIGDVPDVIRRRRNKIGEHRSDGGFVPGA